MPAKKTNAKTHEGYGGYGVRARFMPEVVKDANAQVSNALRELLRVEGLSQAEACRVGGIDQSQLSVLLNGNKNPTIATIATVVASLGYRVVIKYEKRG